MPDNRGGRRPGAGRPRGSKNKMTIAKKAIAEVLDVDDDTTLESAVHKRGHRLLLELEHIAMDCTQPVAARIMAAKIALPFLLPRNQVSREEADYKHDIVATIQERRDKLAQLREDVLKALPEPIRDYSELER